MNRRQLLKSALALTAVPVLAPSLAHASAFVEYTPGAIQSALAQGQTVFVDYSATWCSTCARQERVIGALRAQNPAYDGAMTFFRVDWDTYSRHEVTTSRSIPRRSTLLVLKGDQELGRVVAGTSEEQIKSLMDLGL
ncbi:MAG: thioredoxin family protein [Devosiaceae bacterium]